MNIADFEARNEPVVDRNRQQSKTIDICKQIPFCNGFYVINKLKDIPIEMDYYKSPSGQNNVEGFLNKVNNVEFQKSDFFKQNRKPKITIKSKILFKKQIFIGYVIQNLEMLLIKLNIIVNYPVII